MWLFRRPGAAALLGPLSLLLLAQAPAPAVSVVDDLAAFGFPPTTGAAPGYVADRACALCHVDIAKSFALKGMGRAFQKPRPAVEIEDLAARPFVHNPSGQLFQMTRREGRLLFQRWQSGPDGRPINVFETPVDWILGSGDHARTYLYQTPGGELYQLPLAWYTQEGRWGMAPGFDRPDHEGVLRRVRRECIFCHNAYPDLPAGGDAYGAPQVFPAEMPEGIGCQRCHGPGAEHVGLALGGIGLREEIRASIFNSGRLPPARRDEVCQGCHLQPSVAIPGLRRFGRGDFSHRPAEPLADYLVQVDVREEGKDPADRFEINHHPYRLQQSRCFLESGGKLSCLTCHDPHKRIPERTKAGFFRGVCESCHGREACTRPEHAAGAGPGDCVSCHMPKRRTEDVVHVVMTDHKITRTPGGPALLAPRAEEDARCGPRQNARAAIAIFAALAEPQAMIPSAKPAATAGSVPAGTSSPCQSCRRSHQGEPARAPAGWKRSSPRYRRRAIPSAKGNCSIAGARSPSTGTSSSSTCSRSRASTFWLPQRKTLPNRVLCARLPSPKSAGSN